MSADEGRTWKLTAVLKGKWDAFPVTVPGDGLYWFRVRIVDKLDNPLEPEFNQITKPALQVRVVTKPKANDTDATLADLEAQLKAIQQRIAALKALEEKPAKPGTKVGH